MNKRMEMIAQMIPQGEIVADIGTDHAQCCILLAQEGKSTKLYACDLRQGPLEMAKTHIAQAHLESMITPILSNGFAHVPHDITTAVIAGMGFCTVQQILLDAMERARELRHLLIQVNDDPISARAWLAACGFVIQQEELVKDRGKFYVVMDVKAQTDPFAYEDTALILGPLLLKRRQEPLIQEWIKNQLEQLQKIQAQAGQLTPRQQRLLQVYLQLTNTLSS